MADTPYYLFNREKIIGNYQEMCKNLSLCDVYYALKPNAEMQVLETLETQGAKFEIASVEELDKLRSLYVHPSRVICSLPVKSVNMIEMMYLYGCRYFVFDDVKELEKLIKYAPESKKVLRIYIGDVQKSAIGYGMDLSTFKDMCNTSSDFLKQIDGFTFYVSKNKNISTLLAVLDRADLYLSMLEKQEMILNIGGNYRLIGEVDQDYYKLLSEKLSSLGKKYRLTLIAEPGHGIIKSAGFLVTKVVLVKQIENEVYVYIDAGTPTGVLFEPDEITLKKEFVSTSEKICYRFYGITCSHQLLFSKTLNFRIDEGDILEFSDYGSYTVCLSNQFHSWKRPDVILE